MYAGKNEREIVEFVLQAENRGLRDPIFFRFGQCFDAPFSENPLPFPG